MQNRESFYSYHKTKKYFLIKLSSLLNKQQHDHEYEKYYKTSNTDH